MWTVTSIKWLTGSPTPNLGYHSLNFHASSQIFKSKLFPTVAFSYHYVYGWQPSQHAVGGQQGGAVGIPDHGRAMQPHLSQLLWAQWFKSHRKLTGVLQLWPLLITRWWHGHWRHGAGYGGIRFVWEVEVDIFWLHKARNDSGEVGRNIDWSREKAMSEKIRTKSWNICQATLIIYTQHFVLVKISEKPCRSAWESWLNDPDFKEAYFKPDVILLATFPQVSH